MVNNNLRRFANIIVVAAICLRANHGPEFAAQTVADWIKVAVTK